MIFEILSWLLIGAAAGISAGLFGVGGGIIIVPALYLLLHRQFSEFGQLMHVAVTTSLFIIIFTGMLSAWKHWQKGAVLTSTLQGLIPGLILGCLLGGLLANQLSAVWLRYAFTVFLLLAATQLFFGLSPKTCRALPSTGNLLGAGSVIGIVSTALGIGGGTMIVPFLVWCRVPIRIAIGTSACCGVAIACTGTIGMMAFAHNNANLPEFFYRNLYLPAIVPILIASMAAVPVGVRLADTLPVTTLRRIFAALLVAIAVNMLLA
ncbi:MAG: sulfite exporter TauE/SafE family protein [Candidatus Eutrophobiaceae bacterium]